MPKPRRNPDPLEQLTVYIDRIVLAEIRSEFPAMALGAAIEQIWRTRSTRTRSSAPAIGKAAPKDPNPPFAAQPARIGARDHVFRPMAGTPRQQCACGAWTGTPKALQPCERPE